MTGASAGQAPGVIKLRLSGAAADIGALAALLADLPPVEVIDRSAAYPSRRDPGERACLTIRITPSGGGGQ